MVRKDNQSKAQASVKWLRLLVILSVAVPLFIYLVFGAVGYVDAREEAELRVSRSLRVAHEHASKVMAASEALQDRVLAMVSGRSPQELRIHAADLHAALLARVKDQPQIQSIWIIDSEGKPIASSRFAQLPVFEVSDRDYFQFHRLRPPGQRYISAPLVTRTTKEKIVDISIGYEDHNGHFGGVINVSLLSAYFQDFYSDLVADEPGLAVNLFREDGAIYTRWPLVGSAPERLAPDSPVMQRLFKGEASAQMRGISSVDRQDRIIAYRKVGAYPLYVGTGMNLTSLRNEVLRQLGALFALGALPVAALFFAARMALRNARTALSTTESLEKEIATRRRAEEALLQAQKLEALGRLTGGVAHDFNNALMVISNNLHLLKRTVPDVGTKQIDSMARAVKSATNLTRQLLAFSRRQPLVAEHVVLQDKLPPTKDLIAPVLGSQIQLEVQVDPATAPVVLDLAELELALLNLSINARDAMPQGGSLVIRARNASESEAGQGMPAMVLIEVTDTGSGIPPELLSKVFEPFFTTKAVGEGTGLGLSQVYGMCQRVGGRAEIASTPGTGTRIRLLFPGAGPQAAREDAAGPAPALAPLGKSLLVVEDNDEVAASLVPILESLGCRVTRVDRAAKARTLLEEGARPDLVLSDVVMPGEIDGVGLARHIRQTWPAQKLLLMTGYAEQLDHIHQMGFDVLPKPCTPQMLHVAIARITQ
ncbi:signal transduction histidine kinase regulating C4-dicarboxylate transport system [Acidovorax sp. CF316]|uniref:hybrid sensor histidine kinase/response regulator n=1 Tax=Acidovorax sp. CF316 TaxID=1144317 RepID=UPI00026BE27E|nr:hybrid sensor histidine kinase/response regulator [Acidovorax sp. CF316]EJE50962.1 signal transduction histidine kinase regulating C4-dicarboxylate transport system [Acidovorax sp. CF316]